MNKKTKLINKLKEYSTILENCYGDCYNCNFYWKCIEEYSDENIVILLNEVIKFIKETED